MKSRISFIGYAILLIAVIFNGQLFAQSFKLHEKLPERTLLVSTAPDIAKACAAFKKSALYTLFEEEEMRQFVHALLEPYHGQIHQGIAMVKQQIGLSIEDILSIFQGEITVALVDVRLNDQMMPVGLLASLQFGDNGDKLRQLLEIAKAATRAPLAAVKSPLGEVYMIQGAPVKAGYALIGDQLVVFSDLALLEEVMNGSGKLLKDSANFKAAKSKIAGHGVPVKLFYLNVEQALQQFLPMIQQMAPPPVVPMAQALGLTDIKAIAIGANLVGEHMHNAFYLHVPNRKGVMGLLDMGALSPELLKKIPAHSMICSTGSMNINSFLTKVEGIMQTVSPDGRVLQMYKEGSKKLEGMIGFSIQNDLLASFGSQSYSFSYMPAEGGLLARNISVIGLKDEKKFRGVVDQVAKLLKCEVKTVTSNGHGILYFASKLGRLGENPFQQMQQANEMQAAVMSIGLSLSGMAFAIEDSNLYIGGSAQDLKSYFEERSSWKGDITSNPDFAKLYKHMPKNPAMLSYMDLRPMFSGLWNTLSPILRPFEGFLRAAGIPFESALLPRAQTISRHFPPGMAAYSADSEGVLMTSYSTIGAALPMVAVVGVVSAIAVPGLMKARVEANEGSAIGVLRTLSVSQEQFKNQALVDQDENGSGEYAFLGELAGTTTLRHSESEDSPRPAVNPTFITPALGPKKDGIATKSGYHFYCYLPGVKGAMGEGDKSRLSYKDAADTIDAQESHYVIYAWPVKRGKTGNRAFVVNQAGEVLCTYDHRYAGSWNKPEAGAAMRSGDRQLFRLVSHDYGTDGNYWYPANN